MNFCPFFVFEKGQTTDMGPGKPRMAQHYLKKWFTAYKTLKFGQVKVVATLLAGLILSQYCQIRILV